MPTTAELKAQNPDWCWNCGDYHLAAHLYEKCAMRTRPPVVFAALTVAKLEDEATIAELSEELRKADEELCSLWDAWAQAGEMVGDEVYRTALARQQARHAQGAEGGE